MEDSENSDWGVPKLPVLVELKLHLILSELGEALSASAAVALALSDDASSTVVDLALSRNFNFLTLPERRE